MNHVEINLDRESDDFGIKVNGEKFSAWTNININADYQGVAHVTIEFFAKVEGHVVVNHNGTPKRFEWHNGEIKDLDAEIKADNH